MSKTRMKAVWETFNEYIHFEDIPEDDHKAIYDYLNSFFEMLEEYKEGYEESIERIGELEFFENIIYFGVRYNNIILELREHPEFEHMTDEEIDYYMQELAMNPLLLKEED